MLIPEEQEQEDEEREDVRKKAKFSEWLDKSEGARRW